MELQDKRIVVIGGSSGMGLAVARAAADRGAKVLIAGRSIEKLAKAKAQIGAKGASFPLDVTREEEVENFFSRLGTLDHLVTAIGGSASGMFLELSDQRVRTLFESRFWGQHRSARHAAHRISPGGSITFFSSFAAAHPFPGFSADSAVNGAVEALCRTLALELAPVRVNAISAQIAPTSTEETGKEAAPLLAPAGGEEFEGAAEAVLFFLRSASVTGVVLPVAVGAGPS